MVFFFAHSSLSELIKQANILRPRIACEKAHSFFSTALIALFTMNMLFKCKIYDFLNRSTDYRKAPNIMSVTLTLL